MPQMMPLWWFTLFSFFILMLLTFSFINYYSFIPQPSSPSKSLSPKISTWKW
uniref:ATP synthase complex subunit 8 n=1 Tax=Gromphadorhina oblongonota TaxID=406577 RepID=A0A2P1H7C6_9NEOP|nr:ATP synthase F0 subunit 8 [Gromphadorhina oblongonota]